MIHSLVMYILATLVFLAGIAAGAAYGWWMQLSWTGLAGAVIIGGFIGSAVGAMLFALLYLGGSEPDEEPPGPDALPAGDSKRSLLPSGIAGFLPWNREDKPVDKPSENGMRHSKNIEKQTSSAASGNVAPDSAQPEQACPREPVTVPKEPASPVAPPRPAARKGETDKQRIKRLEKEIRRLKKKKKRT